MLGYRLRHVHDNTGGSGGSGGNDANRGGNGGGIVNNSHPIIPGITASSLSQSHEEALLMRWAWQAEQTQILLGAPLSSN